MTRPDRPRTAIVAVCVAGTVAVVLYAAFAALQILVLNPLAAAPGKTLEQIHADLAAAGEAVAPAVPLIILGIGVGLAVLLLVFFTVNSDAAPWTALLAYGLLLTFGAPAYFIASFGAGMALADTYFISGADQSGWSLVLFAVSAAALVAVVALCVGPTITGARRTEPRTS